MDYGDGVGFFNLKKKFATWKVLNLMPSGDEKTRTTNKILTCVSEGQKGEWEC